MESKVEEAQAESVVREFSFSDAKALAPGPADDEFSSQDTCRSAGYMRRKSSTALLALERFVRSRERVWSTTLSTLIASITMLLGGFTYGFPSASVLQLQELPGSRRFDILQINLSVVNADVYAGMH